MRFLLYCFFGLCEGLQASNFNNALIISGPGYILGTANNLQTRQVARGNTATISTSGSVPGNFASYGQVWDLRVDDTNFPPPALTSLEQSSYLSYLQGGGVLFLMGENTSAVNRNQSILSIVQNAGGGTLTLGGNSPMGAPNTIFAPFSTTPNSVPTYAYAQAGSVISLGTGRAISQNIPVGYTGVA